MDKETVAQIKSAINTAAGVASTIAPEYAPFIILGQAVAAAAPDLINDVEAMLSKQEPTDEDTQNLAVKIAALKNPASL